MKQPLGSAAFFVVHRVGNSRITRRNGGTVHHLFVILPWEGASRMRQFYWKWLKTALSHSLGIADLCSSTAGAICGVLVHYVPESQSLVTNLTWQIPLWTLGAIVVVRMLLAPYWMFSALKHVEDTLARISEDRPFRFSEFILGSSVQPHHSQMIWIINDIALEFENLSDRRISWTIKELFFEYRGTRTEIPLAPGSGPYCLFPRQRATYNFDVPDLKIELAILGVLTSIRIGFQIIYDNIPPLRVRQTERLLDCKIRSLRPVDYHWDIVKELEC
jgi:hypothetical protein